MTKPEAPEKDEILDELHEIRRKLAKETAGMTSRQRADFYRRDAEEFMKKHDLHLPRLEKARR